MLFRHLPEGEGELSEEAPRGGEATPLFDIYYKTAKQSRAPPLGGGDGKPLSWLV